MKIKTLEGIYNNTLKNINFVSSFGFNFSANDTSCINIESLINNLNSDYSKTVQIYDTNNNQHELTLNQLKVLRSEILHTRNLLLQNKNNLIKKIEFAESSTALDEIIFDFSLYF